MNRRSAEDLIRALADADRIALTEHARVRAPHVGKLPLTRSQIRQCLLNGRIVEGPAPDIRMADGWKFAMRRFHDEERHEVVGVLVPERNVLVITGFAWAPRKRRTHRDDGGG